MGKSDLARQLPSVALDTVRVLRHAKGTYLLPNLQHIKWRAALYDFGNFSAIKLYLSPGVTHIKCYFDAEHLAFLIPVLRNQPSIRHLTLSCNHYPLDPTATDALLKSASERDALEQFDFDGVASPSVFARFARLPRLSIL